MQLGHCKGQVEWAWMREYVQSCALMNWTLLSDEKSSFLTKGAMHSARRVTRNTLNKFARFFLYFKRALAALRMVIWCCFCVSGCSFASTHRTVRSQLCHRFVLILERKLHSHIIFCFYNPTRPVRPSVLPQHSPCLNPFKKEPTPAVSRFFCCPKIDIKEAFLTVWSKNLKRRYKNIFNLYQRAFCLESNHWMLVLSYFRNGLMSS